MKGAAVEVRQDVPETLTQPHRNGAEGASAPGFELLHHRRPLGQALILLVAHQTALPVGGVEHTRRLIDVQIGAHALEAVAAMVLQRRAGPHRQSAQPEIMQSQPAHQVGKIVGVLVEQHRGRQGQPVRAPETAQIRKDEAIAMGVTQGEGKPERPLHGKAVQQHDRFAASDVDIVEFCAVAHLHSGHVWSMPVSRIIASRRPHQCGGQRCARDSLA